MREEFLGADQRPSLPAGVAEKVVEGDEGRQAPADRASVRRGVREPLEEFELPALGLPVPVRGCRAAPRGHQGASGTRPARSRSGRSPRRAAGRGLLPCCTAVRACSGRPSAASSSARSTRSPASSMRTVAPPTPRYGSRDSASSRDSTAHRWLLVCQQRVDRPPASGWEVGKCRDRAQAASEHVGLRGGRVRRHLEQPLLERGSRRVRPSRRGQPIPEWRGRRAGGS